MDLMEQEILDNVNGTMTVFTAHDGELTFLQMDK